MWSLDLIGNSKCKYNYYFRTKWNRIFVNIDENYQDGMLIMGLLTHIHDVT